MGLGDRVLRPVRADHDPRAANRLRRAGRRVRAQVRTQNRRLSRYGIRLRFYGAVVRPLGRSGEEAK